MAKATWATLVAVLLWLPASATGQGLTRYVNPLIGSAGNGLVAPGAAVPFGMVQNSPDTVGAIGGGGFQAENQAIQGLSLLHLSGAGVKSEGDLPFMPVIGPVQADDRARFASTFDTASEHAEPGYYRVHLVQSGIDVELTATERTAVQRYTFPPGAPAAVVIDAAQSLEGSRRAHIAFTGRSEVSGSTFGRYPVYFVARFDRPFASRGGFRRGRERAAGGWVDFDTSRSPAVTVHVGVSFVDVAHARLSLDRETRGRDFDAIRARALDAWERALSTVAVTGGSDDERVTFYTALYHALQYPTVFSDVDGSYLGFDRRVHRAKRRVQYADFSAWDSYRAQDQLLAWLFPARYRDILLSLLDDYRRGGRLPRWGEKDLDAGYQFGDPAIPMIADGVCMGLLSRADEEALYRAAADLVRRRPLLFEALGYVPGDVSRTLEYGVDDFALALIADRLGHSDVAAAEARRSLAYRNVLDPAIGWTRPRLADGTWVSPFDIDGTTGFTESTSRRNSWLAPHDARGLFERMSDPAGVAYRLDELVKGSLYGRDNEEDMQVPWMYAFLGAPWRGQAVVRQLQPAFTPARDGIPGNDDLGGLSSGHVFLALGLGPVTAGAPFKVIGSPEFPEVKVTPQGGGAPFTISAPDASNASPYVLSASLDGAALGRAWLYDSALQAGGRLELAMGGSPNVSWGAAEADAPPSLSDSGLERFGCRG